jgi:hypothetical protein
VERNNAQASLSGYTYFYGIFNIVEEKYEVDGEGLKFEISLHRKKPPEESGGTTKNTSTMLWLHRNE